MAIETATKVNETDIVVGRRPTSVFSQRQSSSLGGIGKATPLLDFDFVRQSSTMGRSDRPVDLPSTHFNVCSCSVCCSQDFSSDGTAFESNFTTFGVKWPQAKGKGTPVEVTYSYTDLFDGGMKGDVDSAELKSAIEESFALWAQYAPLKFVEVKDTGPKTRSNRDAADIRIGHDFLGGRGGTLGRANLSTGSGELATTIVFDNAENWAFQGSGLSIDFLEVAVHEIGHALGLNHESGRSAIMNPTIKNRYSGLGSAFLLQDDIDGIRSLYGKGKGSVKPLKGQAPPIPDPIPTPNPEPPKPDPTPTPNPEPPKPDPTPTPVPIPAPKDSGEPSVYEQYALELINQARLDAGIQPLSFNSQLLKASGGHSQWMSETGRVSTRGVNGSGPSDRIQAAGYTFAQNAVVKEQIAYRAKSGNPAIADLLDEQHQQAMNKNNRREDILNGTFREIGIGIEQQKSGSTQSLWTTRDFVKSGSPVYLTGIAFDDSVIDDDFYTIGEGLGNINIKATRRSDKAVFRTKTFGSGGYQVAIEPGTYDIAFSGGKLGKTVKQTVKIGSQNVKLDLATDQLAGNNTPDKPVPNARTIGEYGTLTLNDNWQTVDLDKTYKNPVVIVSDPTFNGRDPAVVRLRKVGGDTFQVRLQEPRYKDDRHMDESVSYIVMEAGDWTLSDGTRISVGTQKSSRLTSKGFDAVKLDGFDATPTVLSQIQTANGRDWVTTRTRRQSAKGFQMSMQEEEALNEGGHAEETVGWLAIEQGVAADGDTLIQGGTTGQNYDSDRARIRFESEFDSMPSVIAKLSSFNGGDTANLRLDDINRKSFGVSVYEEQSLDSELTHINESVSFLALENKSGSLMGLAA